MVRPLEYGPIHLSTEEVAWRAGHKVLTEVDIYGRLIVGDPRGILAISSGFDQSNV